MLTDNILLSPHFKLHEFTESVKARDHGIDNSPPPEAVENLRRLCESCLEPLREALHLPVFITSGFRTKELNSLLVHHSEHSQHMAGQAADLYIGSGLKVLGRAKRQSRAHGKGLSRRELLIKAFRLIITSEVIDYDQLILYPTFIHVSYASKERNRHNILLGRQDGKLGYGKLSVQNALKIQ